MTFYLSGAGAYCAFLLFNKFSDRECSKTDRTSWLVVAIASALWIIVIPISLIEVRTKAKDKQQLAVTESTNLATKLQYETQVELTEEFDSGNLSQLNASNS